MIIKGSKAPTKQQNLSELIRKASSTSNSMNDREKIQNFESIFIQNIKLKHKVKLLEAKIIELKFKRPTQETSISKAKKYSSKKIMGRVKEVV